ncbi:hypothetical protein BC832DRAFT_589256 [Gaertneriomyces semiglobifer]|nr:hypothetical protein BC832DRAFT_589256 [Gaertneriomyces semiglobifer]
MPKVDSTLGAHKLPAPRGTQPEAKGDKTYYIPRSILNTFTKPAPLSEFYPQLASTMPMGPSTNTMLSPNYNWTSQVFDTADADESGVVSATAERPVSEDYNYYNYSDDPLAAYTQLGVPAGDMTSPLTPGMSETPLYDGLPGNPSDLMMSDPSELLPHGMDPDSPEGLAAIAAALVNGEAAAGSPLFVDAQSPFIAVTPASPLHGDMSASLSAEMEHQGHSPALSDPPGDAAAPKHHFGINNLPPSTPINPATNNIYPSSPGRHAGVSHFSRHGTPNVFGNGSSHRAPALPPLSLSPSHGSHSTSNMTPGKKRKASGSSHSPTSPTSPSFLESPTSATSPTTIGDDKQPLKKRPKKAKKTRALTPPPVDPAIKAEQLANKRKLAARLKVKMLATRKMTPAEAGLTAEDIQQVSETSGPITNAYVGRIAATSRMQNSWAYDQYNQHIAAMYHQQQVLANYGYDSMGVSSPYGYSAYSNPDEYGNHGDYAGSPTQDPNNPYASAPNSGFPNNGDFPNHLNDYQSSSDYTSSNEHLNGQDFNTISHGTPRTSSEFPTGHDTNYYLSDIPHDVDMNGSMNLGVGDAPHDLSLSNMGGYEVSPLPPAPADDNAAAPTTESLLISLAATANGDSGDISLFEFEGLDLTTSLLAL